MAEANSILYDAKLKKSKDYQFLRKEAIAFVQKMSGNIWTDYNEHDPGVTILEQFCYALTDIAYRTNINIEQLLFSGGDYKEISQSNALFPPEDILPCGPTTIDDYRILIVDRIKQVSNAWVMPVIPSDTKQNVNGLYNVVLKVASDVPHKKYAEISQKVRDQFSKGFRNVGEDVNEIKVLEPLPIEVGLNIEIAQDAVGEEVLAEIYYQIDAYFNPQVKFYTYEELAEAGADLFEIYNTPSFEHGFVRKEEFEDHKNKVLISQVNEIIANVTGVRVVRDFLVKKNRLQIYEDTLDIGSDFFVELENLKSQYIDEGEIVMTKGGVHYNYDPDLVLHLYDMKLAREKKEYKVKSRRKVNKPNNIDLKKLSEFSSIQNTLPGLYGVGKYGLPSDVKQSRIAQSKQLQGYLYFFDQIMANHLAQLEKIRDLFAVDVDAQSSYFGKLPTNLAGKEDILGNASDDMVTGILGQFDNAVDRKNMLLDHLLSRFGERFNTHLEGNVKSLFGQLSTDQIKQELLYLKVQFLKHYRQTSRERFKAYNYGEPSWDTANVPTFRKRIYWLLNIGKIHEETEDANAEKTESRSDLRSLVEYYDQKKPEIKRPGEVAVKTSATESKDKLSYKHVDKSGPRFTFLVKDKSVMSYLLMQGITTGNYKLIKSDNDKYLVLFQVKRNETPVKVCEVDSVKSGKEAIAKLTRHFNQINQKSEGFHIVEHVLLRSLTLTEYNFEVFGKADKVIFKSVDAHDLPTQKMLAQDALLSGCKRSSYIRIQKSNGRHALYVVSDKGKRLMQYTETMASEEGAARKVDDLIQYFKEIDQTGNAIDKKVNFEIGSSNKPQVETDFFRSKISIVLPQWVPRFRSQEFNTLFRSALSQSLPAHISVNFVWLSVDEMRGFESVYKEWLETKSDEAIDNKKIDTLSEKLIKLLTVKKNDSERISK